MTKITKILIFLAFSLFFISMLNGYLSVKLWDYDFWWHLATGKYVVENKALPEKDPFSFPTSLEENRNNYPQRDQLILKQYWLSQVVFYKVYSTFGDKGIIVLRSLILFSILLSIFLWFKKQNIVFYIIYPFIFFVFAHTLTFTGERPVLFTFLFTVIVFIILDNFKQRKSKSIYLLIPLMLIWANLHGGFLLGVMLILTYLVGDGINFLLKRPGTDKRSFMTLCIVGIAAIAASGINPNGINVLTIFSKENKLFEIGTQEYYSPFSLYKSKIREIDLEYIVLLVLFPILAILRRKKMDIIYYLLLGGLLYMSIASLRYLIYYVCISAMILGRELHWSSENYLLRLNVNRNKWNIVAASLILVSSILYASGFLDLNRVTFTQADKMSVPKGAADFIMANNIHGKMFNDMGFGGYLIWRFYPEKKVFIDTRQLNYILTKEYEWMIYARESVMNPELPKGKKPLWERLLDHYAIDVIVLDTVDVFGKTKPLFFKLLNSEKWAPVYYDFISVIFLRNNEGNEQIIKKYRLTADNVYNAVITRLSQWAMHNKHNPYYMLSLGDIFYSMGRYQDALNAYTYAQKRDPGEDYFRLKLKETQKMLENNEVSIRRNEK